MTTDIHADKILILDFGSQYTQLIARRVREIGVYCEIYNCDTSIKDIKAFCPRGVIFSGSPESVTLDNTYRVDSDIFDLNLPILGICYGMQVMAQQLGGEVSGSQVKEFGYAECMAVEPSKLLDGLQDRWIGESRCFDVWMSHGDKVTQLPPGFKCIAKTDSAPFAAMANEALGLYGLQFHPEVTHTHQGLEILKRFVIDISGCSATWNSANIIEDLVADIQNIVGTDQVMLGLSGGVDSSVVAALLHRAIGDQLTCVFVDNGLLRLHEGDQVMQTFKESMGVKVIRADAENRFLDALQGEDDPEKKRKIIGRTFIEVFEKEAEKLSDVKWLAQGTIYPDVIESAATQHGKAHVIKSHHNVGGLPEHMALSLLEPLRELFKDEVRKLGVELGLAHDMVYRHPFPGPGLGVRILGEIKKSYADVLRQADAIFIDELRKADLYQKVSQAFVVFLPVKSVGVVGDARQYEYVVSLRAVETIDFMTARWAHLPYDFLETVSNRIINEVAGISRVTYDISSKPPATIEWE